MTRGMQPDTPRCGAKKPRDGQPCKARAGWGTDHLGIGRCKKHGGSTRNHVASAQRVKAEMAVATYGLAREIDPHQALLEELHRTAGHVAWLQMKVAELEAGHVVMALEGTERGDEDGPLVVIDAKPNVWVTLYQSERKHFAAIAKTCVDVGIEERRVQLAEQEGALIARVIDGILTDLGQRDNPEVPAIVRRHLTLVSNAAA